MASLDKVACEQAPRKDGECETEECTKRSWQGREPVCLSPPFFGALRLRDIPKDGCGGDYTTLKTKLVFQTRELHQWILRNSQYLFQPTPCFKDEHLLTMFHVIGGHQRPVIRTVTSLTLATTRYLVLQAQSAN